MRYTAQQRNQVIADSTGKTIAALEWDETDSYWVMTFTDGTEMAFRFMAEHWPDVTGAPAPSV